MKRHFAIILVLAMFLLPSCEENTRENYLGYGTLIELNQDAFIFSSQGGSATLKCTNLSKFQISSLEIPSSPGPDILPTTDEYYRTISVAADGILISRIDNTSFLITVNPSDIARDWILWMQSGNSFKPIPISQKFLD